MKYLLALILCLVISSDALALGGLTNATGMTATPGGGSSGPTTNPVTVAQGGTGTTTASGARTNLNASAQLPLVAATWGFGDSFVNGAGATNASGTSFYGLIAADVASPYHNLGASGVTVPTINKQIFTSFQHDPRNISVAIVNGGENDNTLCSGGTTGTCGISYSEISNAGMAWIAIPMTNRILASAATAAGTWTAQSDTFQPTITTTYGTSRKSSISGSTLTFNVPSSNATKIGVTFNVVAAQTGTFTVSIDGSLVTDVCSASTTFTSAPCSANPTVSTYTFYRQEYTVTAGTTHTVIITMTNSANAEITSIDWNATGGVNNGVLKVGVPSNWATNNFALWNTIDGNVATTLAADGFNTYYVDLVSGNPGVNNALDFSASATTTCPATTTTAGGNHPNDCGHYHIYQTIENTAISNNYIFADFGAGGKNPQSTTLVNNPIVGTFQNPNANLTHAQVFWATAANDNVSLPSGIDFFRSSGNTGALSGAVSFTDQSAGNPWSGNNIVGLYSGTVFRAYACAVNDANGLNNINGNSSFTAQACFATDKGTLYAPALVSAGGAKFTISGCSASTTVGGPTAGTYTSGTTGTCTTVITMNGATGITSPNGWACTASDQTTPADLITQTASNATTATLAGTTLSGDVISFHCMGF